MWSKHNDTKCDFKRNEPGDEKMVAAQATVRRLPKNKAKGSREILRIMPPFKEAG